MDCSYIIRLIGMLSGVLIGHFVSAQQLSIQARLNRPEIKTGEQAVIDVAIRTPDISKTKFYLQDNPQAGEPYMVLSFLPYDTIDIQDGLQEIFARMVITSFDSTLVTIPPIIAETSTEHAETQPMALNVVQPEVDASHPEHFKPDKGIWNISVNWFDWLYWVVTRPIVWIILLLGFMLYAYGYYRRNQSLSKEADSQTDIEEITALQRAVEALNIVRGYPLKNQADFKEYYTKVIDILKEYMDEKRGWRTQEMTSQELLKVIADDSSTLRPLLWSLLVDADMSKFAKAELMVSDAHAALEKALIFLNQAEEIWADRLLNNSI